MSAYSIKLSLLVRLWYVALLYRTLLNHGSIEPSSLAYVKLLVADNIVVVNSVVTHLLGKLQRSSSTAIYGHFKIVEHYRWEKNN